MWKSELRRARQEEEASTSSDPTPVPPPAAERPSRSQPLPVATPVNVPRQSGEQRDVAVAVVVSASVGETTSSSTDGGGNASSSTSLPPSAAASGNPTALRAAAAARRLGGAVPAHGSGIQGRIAAVDEDGHRGGAEEAALRDLAARYPALLATQDPELLMEVQNLLTEHMSGHRGVASTLLPEINRLAELAKEFEGVAVSSALQPGVYVLWRFATEELGIRSHHTFPPTV